MVPKVPQNTGRSEMLCSGGNNQELRLGSVRYVMSLNFLSTIRFVQILNAEDSSRLNYAFIAREESLK